MSSESFSMHNRIKILSFSGGNFITEFVSTVFGSWLFFFYEIEVGLDGWLITLGYLIYAVWSALNSPLIGYYTNRSTRLTRRWGRHFPWILISVFPCFFCLYFIYSLPLFNPQSAQWVIFLWFALFLCLYNFFFTIFGVNYTSLFPKKFRSDLERRKASGIIGGISFIASGFSSVLPALVIQFNDKASYAVMALVSMVIAGIVMLLTIPGIREDKNQIKQYLTRQNSNPNQTFFKTLKFAIKQRNLAVLTIVMFLNLIIMQSVGAAFPYAVKYIFNAPAITIALISLLYIAGAVISMPVWTKLGNKINNNRKTFLITCVFLIGSQIFLLVVSDLLFASISAFIFGFYLAGFWTTLTMPINADVLDEIAVLTGERNESIYMGIRGFFVSFSIVAQSIMFTIIHKTTGFVENAEIQSELAQWGIRFTLALIPLVCTLLTLLIFWKIYDLTPERVDSIKARLKELKL
jgi:GPH family glycoside/pentoside/hexuronide:cation symporter